MKAMRNMQQSMICKGELATDFSTSYTYPSYQYICTTQLLIFQVNFASAVKGDGRQLNQRSLCTKTG